MTSKVMLVCLLEGLYAPRLPICRMRAITRFTQPLASLARVNFRSNATKVLSSCARTSENGALSVALALRACNSRMRFCCAVLGASFLPALGVAGVTGVLIGLFLLYRIEFYSKNRIQT